jgi:hypothetical protein
VHCTYNWLGSDTSIQILSKNSKDWYSVNHYVGEETCGKSASGIVFKALDKLLLTVKQTLSDPSNTFLKLNIVPKSSPKLLNNLYW